MFQALIFKEWKEKEKTLVLYFFLYVSYTIRGELEFCVKGDQNQRVYNNILSIT